MVAWLYGLVLIPLGALIAADTVNQVVAAKVLAPPPASSAGAGAPSPGEQGQPLREDTQAPLIQAILTGPLFPHAAVAMAKPAAAPRRVSPGLPRQLRLIGTMAGTGLPVGAVIQDTVANSQRLYRMGDLVGRGAEVVGIDRYAITLKDRQTGALFRLLPQDERAQAGGAPAARPASIGARKSAPGGTLTRVLDRREIDARLDDLPRLFTQMQATPTFANGQLQGYTLLGIKPGSFFDQIGLQNQDVVRRINNMEIRDPGRMLQVLQQLRQERTVSVDVLRGGQPLTVVYETR